VNTSTSLSYQPQNSALLQSTVSEKGQITVPLNVRKILNIKKGDKVSFIVKNKYNVKLVKKTSVVAQTAGILKSLKPPLSAKELREEAEHAIAKEAIQRAGKS